MRVLAAPLFLFLWASSAEAAPPKTVPSVDLERFLGTWYEIAAFPKWFQKGCTATESLYEKGEKQGELKVTNLCRKGSPAGREKRTEGRLRVVDPQSRSKLEVSFFGPFWGDFWIFELGENYEYAVVGSPERDSLWILSRTRQMDPALYGEIVERMKAQGFEVARLRKTEH